MKSISIPRASVCASHRHERSPCTDRQTNRSAELRADSPLVEPILAAVAWTDGVIAAVCREIGAAVIEGLGAHGAAYCGRAPNHPHDEDDDVRR